MRSLTRELEPVKLQGSSWQREVLNVPVVCDDESDEFRGEALSSSLSTGHQIEFEFSSNPFRPAEIRIALGVTASALAEIFIAGQTVDTFSLKESTDSTLVINLLRADVSEWSEAREKTLICLRVTYQHQTGKSTILLDGAPAEFQSRVVQNWSWPGFLQASLFFGLAWLTIMGSALIILANTSAGREYWNFTLLSTIVVWAAAVLGLPDLAKVPVRPVLRRIYSRTKKHRVVSLVLLAVLFTLVSVWAGFISSSLYTRNRYSTLIQQARENLNSNESTYLRQAFILLPWRKEAQFLFEKQAYSKRYAKNPKEFRRFVRGFVADSEIKATILRLTQTNSLPFCLTHEGGATADPVIWYASLLPEAENGSETELKKEAIKILSSRTDPEAVLLRLSIEIEINQSDPNQMAAIAQQMKSAVDKPEFSSALTSFSYQVVCDRLGQFSIQTCGPTGASDAAEWFGRIINAREHPPTDGDVILWARPPDKLVLYHMFRFEDGVKDGELAEAANEYLNYCDFKTQFDSKFKAYADYMKEKPWKQGSVLDDNLTPKIEKLINAGWRY